MLGYASSDPLNPAGSTQRSRARPRGSASGPARRDIPADRVSIQSNLQAHEKSTLDNRQFLCSAASRGVTRLARVWGEGQRQGGGGGVGGGGATAPASTVRGRSGWWGNIRNCHLHHYQSCGSCRSLVGKTGETGRGGVGFIASTTRCKSKPPKLNRKQFQSVLVLQRREKRGKNEKL